MELIAINYRISVIFVVLLEASCICAGESKTLAQEILNNPKSKWRDLHQLPSQLIGSMILHNHPIVSFILNKTYVVTTLKGRISKGHCAIFNSLGDKILFIPQSSVHQNRKDRTVSLWEPSSDKCVHTLTGHSSKINSAVFNGSGDRVLTASDDKTARLWETNSGKCIYILKGHSSRINTAVFNGSGDRVLTASDDNTAKLWDTNTGTCLRTLRGHLDWVTSAVFTCSGAMILTASIDETAKLWETRNGRCLHSLMAYSASVRPVVPASSGTMVFTASGCDGSIKLWETSTGKCLHTLEGTGLFYTVTSAVFNRLGDMVLIASTDSYGGVATIVDTNSGECLKTLGHSAPINSAVFNGSGNMILTASQDGTAKLWETSTGKCLQTLRESADAVTSAEFNSSGDIILTASGDGRIRLYNIGLLFELQSFFSRDDSISLNQAIMLLEIYKVIICRRLPKITKGGLLNLNFKKREDSLKKDLSTFTDGQDISSDRTILDFHKCSHLQADYEKLPQAIQTILDEYVRKTPPKNNSLAVSITDESDFSTGSTSDKS